ncbi:patatin-like phospholipase family protein [Weeksellaceae bacterium TAE3-ERU29]|nr:patatin-like phospholipase family protein [Weeksellaceae bacterium TAE3-ERU29]
MKKILLLILCINISFTYAQNDRPKIGLVLSGGGAKGYAHIGVLEELEKAQIPIDYIGGTSMGAIVGGLYASGYSAKDLNRILHLIDLEDMIYNEKSRENSPFFQKQYEEKYLLSLEIEKFKPILPKSISKGQGALNLLTKYLQHVHDKKDFSKLSIPFLCVATNLETGEGEVFRKGYLPEVIMASGAYPTLFSPVKIDSVYYIDGGIKNNFPVQEVRNMGADIIIGVDLAEGLLKENQIKNVANLLGQIISYGIESKTTEQRKKVDLLLKPKIKGFTVTSFNEKDTLIELGRQAVLEKKSLLDSISKIVGKRKRIPSTTLLEGIYLLDNIEVKGLENYTKNYVLGKFRSKLPQAINYDMILEGINNLYATGNFKDISHRLEKNNNGAYTLYLDVTENEEKVYIKAGLHYDELFKSSLLLNLTAKNIISINSTFSLDVIVGDNPRYYFYYFVDNGIVPSFGLNSNFKKFSLEKRIDKTSEQQLDYGVTNFKNQIYTQSTFRERYALGFGFEHQYLKMETQNLPIQDKRRVLQDNHFYIPYGYLKIDDRDNKYFPKRGTHLDAELDYIMASTAINEYDPLYILKTNIETNIPLNKDFTLQLGTIFNTHFNADIPPGLEFYIGGQQRQEILNTVPFSGLKFASLSAGSLLGINGAIQFNFLKRNYIKLNIDLMSISDNFENIELLKFDYQGYALTYTYDSRFGPLSGTLSYSPNNGKVYPYISLGYWF